MKRNIAIFGSGSILSTELIALWKNRHALTVVYSGEKPSVVFPEPEYISLADVFEKKPGLDAVVIISAYVPGIDVENQRLYDVNVGLVEKIVDAYPAARIIFCSTVSVYRPENNVVHQETSAADPQNEYALSKLWAEKILARKAGNACIFRISSLTGRGMKENTFMPVIIGKALKEKEITLFGDGAREQNYIHVADLAAMIDAALEKNTGGIFLGVGSGSHSNLEVAEKVRQKLPGTKITFFGSDESRSYRFNAARTYHQLGYTPKKNIDTIIDELIVWKTEQY
jgi:nucleoside-diphosphate-sugar epimerase